MFFTLSKDSLSLCLKPFHSFVDGMHVHTSNTNCILFCYVLILIIVFRVGKRRVYE